LSYNYNGYRPSFKERIYRFFSGRNGSDALAFAFIALYFVVCVINVFVSSIVLTIFGWLLLFYAWFRVLSKNVYKRRMENEKFRRLLFKFTNFFKIKLRAFKERKIYAYRKCPSCKSTLRLPKKKGKHGTRCPRCHKEFSVKI